MDVHPAEKEFLKFKEHSVMLNRIGYKVAVALGKVVPPEDYDGDPEQLVDELIATANRYRETLYGKS